jgi:heme/copper-type cytochrome/quinol oxidase subunit 3
MTELAQHGTGYDIVEGEPPELLARNLNAAGHLLASATAFFFLAFVFGYFYLRSLNNAGLWHPKGVHPAQTLGALVMALSVASAIVLRLGLTDHRAGRRPEWRRKGSAALALGVVALILQIVEWATLGFGPTDGGYASIFYGWTAFQLLFTVGALWWLENVLATSIRYRGYPKRVPAPGHASGDPDRTAHDIEDPVTLVRAGLEGASFYWAFLAGLGVLAWVILYLA